MLNRTVRISVVSLAMSLAIMSLGTGCSVLKKTPVETETETQSETVPETESETETETETEIETEVAYASQDKSIRITLPDSTWKVTQDVDEMRVFSSGSAAMINIVHAEGDSAMKNTSLAESEDALKESLTKQYAESNAFEVQEFEKLSSDTLDTYEYVVKYNSTSMWAYVVTYGIVAENEAYVITGTVTDDNKVLLEAVKKSVESFTVVNNKTFSALPGTVVNKTDSESESESEADTSTELKSLSEYGYNATLYASGDIVNVRQQPSTEADILSTLTQGDKVTVTGETSQWFRVNINGNVGYISKALLVSTAPTTTTQTDASQSTSSSELNNYYDYGTSYTYYATTDVNLRAQPGTDSSQIGGLSGGQAVTVIGETPNWYVVSVNGTTAYVSKSYISSTNTYTSNGNNTNTNTSTGGGTTNTGTGTVSGTIVDASMNTITISGDDGNTYILNTSDASISTSDGIYTGLYVAATVDYSNSSGGALYATSVNGY